MDKVYLLLRKNQQTGPYTYEELLQQQLVPTDLIWVEGKSMAWIYPSELNSLVEKTAKNKAASPEAVNHTGRVAPQNTPNETPWYEKRKSPEAELEERALALRQRAEAAATSQQPYRPSPPAPVHQHHRREHMVYQEEEPPILLEVHTVRKKSVTLPQLIAAGVITALVVAGWYNRDVLTAVRPQPDIVTQAAAPALFQVSLPTPPQPAVAAVVDTAASEPQAGELVAVAATAEAAPHAKPVKTEAKAPIAVAPETAVVEPPVVPTAKTGKKEAASPDTAVAGKAPAKKDTAAAAVAQASDDKGSDDAEVEAAAPHKKKGLGQALKSIFKKKKKKEDKAAEEENDTE